MKIHGQTKIKFTNGPNSTVHNIIGNRDDIYKRLQVGVEDVSLKVTSQSVVASFTLKLPNVTIGNMSDYETELKKIFDLRNTWSIELDYEQVVEFKNMKAFEINLDYSSSIKGVEISITLLGSLMSGLNYIRMGNICGELNLENNTLEEIVKNILNVSRNRVQAMSEGDYDEIKVENDEKNEIRTSGPWAPSPGPGITLLKPNRLTDFDRNILDPDARSLQYFDHSSIPTFSDIDVVLSIEGSAPNNNKTEVEQYEAQYSRIWRNPLPADMIKEFRNSKPEDTTTVFAFLKEFLMSQGLLLIQIPHVKNTSQVNTFMIIPITAVPTGSFEEKLFRNGHLITDVNKNNFELDLLSTDNVVLSINASTQKGKESIQSITQAKNQALDTTVGEAEATTMFNLLESTTKSIDIEIYGMPALNYYTTIELQLIGDMFSGTYKVIEFEHKISGQKFTTNMSTVRISDKEGRSSVDVAKKTNPDNTVPFGPPEFHGEVPKLGTDVFKNPRRYM